MRPLFGMLIAGGLLLGAARVPNAQDNLNSAGSYPAGITTGSPYGANWSGYYGLNRGGYPLNTYAPTYRAGTSYYNSTYAPPRTATYGYAPGTTYAARPGYTTTYPGYTTTYPSYRNAYAPGYSYSNANTANQRRGLFRGGLFRRNR
jgi:hypothetical protein